MTHDLHGPDGAPLLVLGSSLGTDRRMWDPQLAALTAAGHRVLRYEHPGHGGAPSRPGPYTLAELAGGVLDLLDQLAERRFAIGGLSLGGMVAIQVAALAPDRVDRLAVFCSSAFLPPASGWLDRAATVRAGGTAAIADTVPSRWFTPRFAAARPQVPAAHRDQLLACDVDGYAGCCEAIAAMDLRPALPVIQAPTLVVAGEQDLATPLPHARVIAAGIPGARLVPVPGAHLATVESPELCTALLLAHLVGKDVR